MIIFGLPGCFKGVSTYPIYLKGVNLSEEEMALNWSRVTSKYHFIQYNRL